MAPAGTHRPRVSVTGASGGIGRALVIRLLATHDVKALVRADTAVSADLERRGCVIVRGDLSDDSALAELVRDTSVVFHCAALVGQATYADAHAINVEGTRRVAEAAARQGCRRLVHLSSIAVYGSSPEGPDCSEDVALPAPETLAVYSRTKLESERVVREVAARDGLEYTILRPTSVYGPDVKSFTTTPVELIRKGLPVVIGDGRGLLDVVHVDDVVAAMLLAADAPAANGEAFNVGHDTIAAGDFYAHYARMLGRPVRHLPLAVLHGMTRVLGSVPGRPRPRLEEAGRGIRLLIGMAQNRRRFPSAKAQALLGYSPAVPLAIGMLGIELGLRRSAPGAPLPPQPSHLDGYGPLPFRPAAVVHPTSEGQIVDTVRMAAGQGVRVRAIGSLHSPSPLPHTDGVCVILDGYTKLVKVDGPLVTVEAGMTIRELNDRLPGLGLALPTNGSITAQTVSGAISTATHGGSVFHGALSDYVEALRIVRADGSVVEVDRSQDVFHGAVVSLGLLGVISTVTFRCVPAFDLMARRTVIPAGEALKDFDRLCRGSLHTNIFYFPVTDQMEILSIDRTERAERLDDRGDAGSAPSRPPAVPGPVARRLRALALRTAAWTVRRHESILRLLTKRSVGSAYQPRTGRSDRVLAVSDVGTTGRTPTLIGDMEIAVRYDQAPAAIAAVRDHFLRTRRFPLIPIHIRCVARSELWLNPAYGQDVCWLEFWQYPPTDDLFDRVHTVLQPFDYRFHWGKTTRADRDYIRRQYPRWDDFVRLREAWDPGGMFLTRYLDPFFGPR